MKKRFFLLILLGPLLVSSQVKIGTSPETIDPGSILELESTSKALVLSRLTNEQMTGINPLNGALIYNTDTSCLHYYSENQWINLCTVLSGIRFTDNGDGTITLEDGQGDEITFNGAEETVSTLTNNLDGTYTYTNESGNQTLLNITDTDNQVLGTDGTPGNIQILNGNTIALNVQDSDSDDQNEIQDIQFNAGVITLTNDPGATNIDLSNYDDDATDDFDGDWSSLSNIPADIADGDDVVSTDANNEIIVGTDDGAFYQSPVKAFGKIAADGSILRATPGVTVTPADLDNNNAPDTGRYQVNLPNNLVNDNNYIILLSQIDDPLDNANNDPGIWYTNQTNTGFVVVIGDNDNGGSNTDEFDSEFMFVIFDL